VSGRGVLVIVSSPSGAGKSTLTGKLLREFPGQLDFSVSYTTREPRKGEVDGTHYHFVSLDKFDEMVRNNEFAEHAFVHGNRYGTARAPIEAALAQDHDIIFDVDWYGGGTLAAIWPEDSLKIFILPPDIATLEKRLRQRATDSEEVIQRRIRKAHDELEHYNEYPNLIVNDDVDHAYNLLRAIYLTRRYANRPAALPEYAALRALVDSNVGAEAHARKLLGK
jgi:guanylate kinase